MPTPVPPGLQIGTAEPRDALAQFARRNLLAPSFLWEDVYAAEHAAGFAVAGVAQLDVLKLFRDGVDHALASGGSLADFSKAIKPQLVAKGWWGDVEITDPATGDTRIGRFDDNRLKLIYDVNLRQSYAAGRWARSERTAAAKPMMMYRTMRDERVRHSHAAWDGVVLQLDDPWWDTHYPPNGWRCRCRAFAVSERDVARYVDDGVEIKRDAPPVSYTEFVNRGTGETSRVPLGIDPGFDYNPGKVGLQRVAELQRNALDSAPPDVAVAVVQQHLGDDNFKRFVAAPLPLQAQPVGMLPARAAAATDSRTLMLATATARQQQVANPELVAADYLWVQRAIDTGQLVPDGDHASVYLLEADGWVAVVRVQRSGRTVALASYRRLTAEQAAGDAEVQRLRTALSGPAPGG